MELKFDNKADFMAKLEELFEKGYSLKKKNMQIFLPHPEHDVEHLVEKYEKPSRLKFFTLVGGLAGCFRICFYLLYRSQLAAHYRGQTADLNTALYGHCF